MSRAPRPKAPPAGSAKGSPSAAAFLLAPAGAGRAGSGVRAFASLPDLIAGLSGAEGALVLVHPAALREADLEVAGRLGDMPGRPSVALLGGEGFLDQAISLARRLELGCVIPESYLSSPAELARAADWIARGGPGAGLARHLAPGTAQETFDLRARGDKSDIIEAILARVETVCPDGSYQFDIRLLLEETLNNAMFHAFRDSAGREKYSVQTFESIAPGEEIGVACAADAETIAISVADNQGRLSRDTVLARLERQISEKGLLDQSGRGLYLTYSLAGRLVFNLARGARTELVMLFPIAPEARPASGSPRAVFIFEK